MTMMMKKGKSRQFCIFFDVSSTWRPSRDGKSLRPTFVSLLPVVYVIEQKVIVAPEPESKVVARRQKLKFKFKCHLCKFGTDESLQVLRSHLNDVHPT